LSTDQRARYTTMFGGSAGESEEVEQSALESRNNRLALLKESIRFTILNPVFGVGPGVYEAYAADVAVSEGRRGHWQVTHNTYSQISSEAGIPALIFWLGALLGCIKATRQIYKANGYGNPEAGRLAYAMFLTLIAFAITAIFDSVVYQMYFPTLAGLTVALVNSVSGERATAPRATEPLPAINPDYRIRQMAPKPPLPV
jgi:O-antigen ligase